MKDGRGICDARGRTGHDLVTNAIVGERASVAVLVAHPDDETLWSGGTLLAHRGWQPFIGTLCRAGDKDRAPRFFQALGVLGAEGAMADLDDGPEQSALGDDEVRATLLSLLPATAFDLVMTHAPGGEYTRHRRHEEVSRGVLGMWGRGELVSPELWLFAYEDGGGSYPPRAVEGADFAVDLTDEVWARKRALLTEVYGFDQQSWETRMAPRREAFWRMRSPDDRLACLEKGTPVR
jgi:LmbE family N-acetylglucosaminyl deacetylase